MQADAAHATRGSVATAHADLIQVAIEHYVPYFLPNFEVLYVDDSDGDRISRREQALLTKAGLKLGLKDAMPDVLLWNRKTDWIWVIEAVTSDGEVDDWKVKQLRVLAKRSGKSGVGFTTVYPSWKKAAARQAKLKNLAPGTHVWIQEDGGKQLSVESH